MFIMTTYVLIALLAFLQLTVQHVVVTTQGVINGISMNGYVSYIGIPYASANGSSARFKRAGPAPLWHGVRESHNSHCSIGSDVENCLQLDVNVPTSGVSLPVFVWIKGGAGEYNAGNIVRQGIIMVTVRHRLGPLGFLCSNNHKIPGNAGLKDALQALRWIQDNIIAFNGNPHKVIIGGQSFGSAMVEALIISPAARGLFHGAILQSGSILAPWALNFDSVERATALSMKFNKNNDLLKISTPDLAKKGEEIDVAYFPFGMCIEEPFKNEERIIFETPFNSMLNAKTIPVPLMIGYNNNEAYIFTRTLRASKILRKAINDLSFLIPMELHFNKKDLSAIANEIQATYFRHNISMDTIFNYYRDAYFLAHIHKSARLHAARTSVFYYQFSYNGNIGVDAEPEVTKKGAAHSDELAYIFSNEIHMNEEDKIVQRNLIGLWTSFVKNLNPNQMGSYGVSWEALNPNYPRVLDINTEMEMIDFPFATETRVWDAINEKYYYTTSRRL